MAKLFGGKKKFVAKDHEEMGTFDALPPDWYTAMIVDSEMKDNKAKIEAKEKGNKIDGEYLKLKFKITEGKFKGRLVWLNLNIIHTNEETVEIAERTLATICNSIGIAGCEDSDELHGEEMQIKLTVTKKTAKYPEGNEIKGFKSLKGVARPPKAKAKAGKDSKAAGNKKVAAKKKPKVTFGKGK